MSSEGASATVTHALVPLNESAEPNLPAAVHVALEGRRRMDGGGHRAGRGVDARAGVNRDSFDPHFNHLP